MLRDGRGIVNRYLAPTPARQNSPPQPHPVPCSPLGPPHGTSGTAQDAQHLQVGLFTLSPATLPVKAAYRAM